MTDSRLNDYPKLQALLTVQFFYADQDFDLSGFAREVVNGNMTDLIDNARTAVDAMFNSAESEHDFNKATLQMVNDRIDTSSLNGIMKTGFWLSALAVDFQRYTQTEEAE